MQHWGKVCLILSFFRSESVDGSGARSSFTTGLDASRRFQLAKVLSANRWFVHNPS